MPASKIPSGQPLTLKPFRTASEVAENQNPPVWLWLNILSLDAPLVAVIWQDFLAYCYPAMLRSPGRWMLGLTVWAIYLADRLLDVRSGYPEIHTPRHAFYRQHFRFGSVLLLAVLAADLIIGLLWLRRSVFENGLLVAAAVGAYLCVFPAGRIRGIGKPAAAAVLFTTGVFLVSWTSMDSPARTLFWPAAAFAALCLGNLALVKLRDSGSGALYGSGLMIALAGVCLGLGDSPWYQGIAISSVALAALFAASERFSRNARGVLADAVLLAPLLFLIYPS